MIRDYDLKRTKLVLESIAIYRNLLEDKVISKLYSLINCVDSEKIELSKFMNLYNDFFFTLAQESKGSLKAHIIDRIIFDENPYSLLMAKKEASDTTILFENAAARDLENLQLVSNTTSLDIKAYIKTYFNGSEFEIKIIDGLPEWKTEDEFNEEYDNYSIHIKEIKEEFYKSNNWSEGIQSLREFYKNKSCGIFARYRAFIWQPDAKGKSFRGIEKPDAITLSELMGYEAERARVIENTLQFLKGFPANNALFYGDRGTGKSSTVKALLNEYYSQGLRMIEVPKTYLTDFPLIISLLKNRPEKFIIFVDDLAFEESGENYNALKAVLEGGLENRPNNVLIYATSNRRHLVKESFKDRAGLQSNNQDDEVRAADNIQEKLSLSDRFGITVTFAAPSQNKYLQIVEGIAEKRNLKFDKEKLYQEALKWQMRYNGRSPRTAKQFIDWVEGSQGLGE